MLVKIFHVFCDVLSKILNYFSISCCLQVWFMLSQLVVALCCENSILQVTVIYGKHKTYTLRNKTIYKSNKQQINNELRPNDFNKGISVRAGIDEQVFYAILLLQQFSLHLHVKLFFCKFTCSNEKFWRRK